MFHLKELSWTLFSRKPKLQRRTTQPYNASLSQGPCTVKWGEMGHPFAAIFLIFFLIQYTPQSITLICASKNSPKYQFCGCSVGNMKNWAFCCCNTYLAIKPIPRFCKHFYMVQSVDPNPNIDFKSLNKAKLTIKHVKNTKWPISPHFDKMKKSPHFTKYIRHYRIFRIFFNHFLNI